MMIIMTKMIIIMTIIITVTMALTATITLLSRWAIPLAVTSTISIMTVLSTTRSQIQCNVFVWRPHVIQKLTIDRSEDDIISGFFRTCKKGIFERLPPER